MSRDNGHSTARDQNTASGQIGRALLDIASHADQQLDHDPLASIVTSHNARAIWQRHLVEVASSGRHAKGADGADVRREASRVRNVVLWARRVQWAMVACVLLILVLRLGLGGDDVLGALATMKRDVGWPAWTPVKTLLLATFGAVGLLLNRIQQQWREA